MIDARQKSLRRRRFIVNSCGPNRDLVSYLYCAVARVWPATAVDAASLADAVEQIIARLRPRDVIQSIQFWGHGRPGAMCVGGEEVKVGSFDSDDPHQEQFLRLLPRLADDAVIWFRGCQTFAGTDGKNFARGAAAFFGRQIQVVGQTRMIGYNLDWGGVVGLGPDQSPQWADIDLRNKALKKEGDGTVGRLARLMRRARSAWSR